MLTYAYSETRGLNGAYGECMRYVDPNATAILRPIGRHGHVVFFHFSSREQPSPG